MKKYYLLIAMSCWLQSVVFAQLKEPSVGYMELSVTQTHLFDADFIGANFGLGVEIKPGWLAGIDFSAATKKVREDFDFVLGKPQLQMMDFSLMTQYQIFTRRLFHIDAFLMAGVASVTLFDASVKVEYETDYGLEERNLEIDKFARFMVKPGLAAFVTLYDWDFAPQINLFGRVGYRHLAGKDKFGALKDFSGTTFNIGVQVIGFL